MGSKKFLIPDGIEYYIAENAHTFELFRSEILKIFKKYKYQFVSTPVIDSLANLCNLNGKSLKNITTPLLYNSDLAIRADITPQVTRIDYQNYHANSSNKYAYMGDIYRESSSPFDRKNSFQVGAEFFGNVDDMIDISLIRMCHEIISLGKPKKMLIEINDSYFINNYLSKIKINKDDKDLLIELIGYKSIYEIKDLFTKLKIGKTRLTELVELISLIGDASVFNDITNFSKRYNYKSSAHIKSLKNISSKLSNMKHSTISVDLCAFKSMDYETGFNYTIYTDNHRLPIAVGGRYDAYTNDDNSVRRATGFSLDLKDIMSIYEK